MLNLDLAEGIDNFLIRIIVAAMQISDTFGLMCSVRILWIRTFIKRDELVAYRGLLHGGLSLLRLKCNGRTLPKFRVSHQCSRRPKSDGGYFLRIRHRRRVGRPTGGAANHQTRSSDIASGIWL